MVNTNGTKNLRAEPKRGTVGKYRRLRFADSLGPKHTGQLRTT